MKIELEKYLKDENLFKDVLNTYYNEITKKWPIEDKINLYDWSIDAFNQSIPYQDREEIFKCIYNELKNKWSVFRNSKRLISYKELFSLLNEPDCQVCSKEHITLLNSQNKFPSVIELCVETVKNIKTNSTGPSVMAFSKFLHFFNPKLFPIYDNEYISKVLQKKLETVSDYIEFVKDVTDLLIELGSSLNKRMQYLKSICFQRIESPSHKKCFSEYSEYYPILFDFVSMGACLNEKENKNKIKLGDQRDILNYQSIRDAGKNMRENLNRKNSIRNATEFVYDFVAKNYPLNSNEKEYLRKEVKQSYTSYNSTNTAILDAERAIRFVPQYWERIEKNPEFKIMSKYQVESALDFISDFIVKQHFFSDGKKEELSLQVSELYPSCKKNTIKDYISNANRIMKYVPQYWKKKKK